MFIYSLYSSQDPDKVYIGSTKMKYLSLRKAQHKYYYKRSLVTGKTNISSNAICKACETSDDLCIEELEEVEDDNKDREDWWIEYLKETGFEVVNKNRAVYSYDIAKERMRKKYKRLKEDGKIPNALKYYYANKDAILEKRRNDYAKYGKC